MKKLIFGYKTTMILLVITVISIISATFIESASGTESAKNIVYNSKWFELVLFLLTINIVGSMFLFRSFSWNKISVPLFHLAFVLIMVGAFFTRYTGKEGSVFIREGEKSNEVYINDLEKIDLPFDLYLEDFVLERYPGSQSPSSYSSFVRVDDPVKGSKFDYHIYMNHILKYRGWRFFQSSFDKDEKGTVLTASKDVIGTPITYAGYSLTILLLLASLIMPGTYFRKQLSKLRTLPVLLLLFLLPTLGFSLDIDKQIIVNKEQASEFGKLVIQDLKGRMKTVNTHDNDFMRKLYGNETMQGLTADQVVLSMTVFPDDWKNVPIIKVSSSAVREKLKLNGKYLSYNQLFSNQGEYILGDPVNAIFMKPQNSRDKTDKALIQLDEKANILHSFLNGEELNIFPVKGSENNKWHSPVEASGYASSSEDSLFLQHIFTLYLSEIAKANQSGDFSQANRYFNAIKKYQELIGSEVMLSSGKIKAELIYNRSGIFDKVKNIAGLAGFVMLIFFFVFILKGKNFKKWWFVTFQIISAILLFAILLGIGLRWYIGGYVPVSNSYEVMIFLSAVVLLAGLLVSQKQPVTLSLSLILAFTFLFVASMNNANPEIGNLVPVLKSYWLSIHVAVITSSYALFAMVMMMALVNLILYLVATPQKFKQISENTEQMGAMIQMMMIIGLYLMTIGTILGAIWANESWGRYWGWDPKETWALISIFVYAFVGHMRLIPALKNEFWTNMAAFWAFSSILMTFFGVNYFLSGMHSYAGAGEATIPTSMWFAIVGLIILTMLSGRNYFKLSSKKSNKA
jgi:cytochrome c-type biogenesis protein CcsB